MSRDGGFATVDHDARFLHDVKVRRLRRQAPDEGEGAIRTLLYLALVNSSWYEGDRMPVEDADTPYDPSDERIAALMAVGLIDDEHRIPEASWSDWFGPANTRREQLRKASAEGNRKRWQSQGDPKGTPEGTPRQTVRQTDRSSRAPAREAGPPNGAPTDPRPLGDILGGLGMKPDIIDPKAKT